MTGVRIGFIFILLILLILYIHVHSKAKMLDTDTKRRIDFARDVLVGKVPDPKSQSQVEQITIALIYKFMDDPACGTAGFLISFYKHILKSNVDANGKLTLTPDERTKLARNLRGYDISPDMVRLSLANLYLHGFTDPHVDEYDTLTSEDKWNEQFAVVLANPPFMSPKGGIKPHKRFTIQSKRSEVLFVDYIAEHLAPAGRAGIIVPEGIIFQSQTAYKQLRKMLVEDYLVAVVSLPGGIFQPYSGVKTSILIMDKAWAKKSGSIAFYKIENNGFGLGAQRRAIEKNDLPDALSKLKEFLNMDIQDEQDENSKSCISCPSMLIVPKSKLAANGEYNLSGERYREGRVSISNPVHLVHPCLLQTPL